ncbi:exported protein of unknown function [Xenorhabdus poinarii G6]|uniref:Lipoprotein n=1 Tax=Xenorhabdus poinarii G6 TaxID=1354304 RepID=A0A068QYY1_9GAMM|nr:hypothetical protein [Xenorhabdus poinarii]CDG20009.1 exported protein of unknown function [Xenorhabdus poinarii G6]
MRKLLIAGVSFSALILSGCLATPNEVKSNKPIPVSSFSVDEKYNLNESDKQFFVPKEQAHVLETVQEIKDANCSYYMNSTGVNNIAIGRVKVVKGAFKKEALFPNSHIECSLREDYQNKGAFKIELSERLTIDGVKVTVRHSSNDGIVVIGRGMGYGDNDTWLSHCNKDAMTDKTSCWITYGNLMIIKDAIGYTSAIGGDIYPGTKGYIRVGKDKPYITIEGEKIRFFDYSMTRKIVRDLEATSSNNAITQYTKWPDGKVINEEISLKHFKVAKKVLDVIYKNYE